MRRVVPVIVLILLVTNIVSAHAVKLEDFEEHQIVFTKVEAGVENIYLMNKHDSSIIHMTEVGGNSPVVSYDGKLMIYRLGDYNRHKNILVDFDKKETTAILDSNAYIYSISPNNDKILYTRYIDAKKYYLQELYISDIDGSNEMKLVSGSDIWEACFSPVENKIAYVKDGHIYILDLDTKKEIQLTYDSPSDGISWAYDGSKIFYAGPEYEIISVSKDGQDKKIIFKDEEILAIKPKISSDGKYIVFLNENDTQLYVINSNGTNLVKLTDSIVCDSPIWIKRSSDQHYKVQDDMFLPSPLLLQE